MSLKKLEALLTRHGHFRCLSRDDDTSEKTVPFRHTVTPAVDVEVPDIGRLREFYGAFGSMTFYHCAQDEAARHLAPPAEWPTYQEEFDMWIADIDGDEWEEIAPIDLLRQGEDGYFDFHALVIGQTPHSGNYILMAESGAVYEFDHDGFEFRLVAPDIVAYAEKVLEPDAMALCDYTTFVTFRDADRDTSWHVASAHFADGEVIDWHDGAS